MRLISGTALGMCAAWGYYSVVLDAMLPRLDFVNMVGDSPDWHRVGLRFVGSTVVAAASIVVLLPIVRDAVGNDARGFAGRPLAYYKRLSRRLRMQVALALGLGTIGIVAFAFDFIMLSQMITYGQNFAVRYELSVLATYAAMLCFAGALLVSAGTALEIALRRRSEPPSDADAT